MSENAVKALLVLGVFGVMFVLLMMAPSSYRECLAEFKPQSYCAAKELAK